MDNISPCMHVCSRAFSREHKQEEIVTCDRSCLQFLLPLHFYLITSIFAALGRGVVAYERRIWCVCVCGSHLANSFLSFSHSIALGFG